MGSSPSGPSNDQPESGPSSSFTPLQPPHTATSSQSPLSEATKSYDAPISSPDRGFTPIPKPSKKDTVEQLRSCLATLGLDTKGKKETLWRRLIRAFNRLAFATSESLPEEQEPTAKGKEKLDQRYKHFLCFDVEATCRGGKEFNWPNEIIEFPVVLCQFQDSRFERIDTFHSYVRPTWQPILTEFCVALTGITQEKVDSSPSFLEVLERFEGWLRKHEIIDDAGHLRDTLWVTDGPWDLRDFVPKQLHITPLRSSAYPLYFLGPYLNLKAAVHAVLSEQWRRDQYALEHPDAPPNMRAVARITTASSLNRKQRDAASKRSGKSFWLGITGMVEALGLGEFEGRAHSGIDDATNVSRILEELVSRGIQIEPNGQLLKPGKKWAWQGEPGEVIFEEWMSDRPAKNKLLYESEGAGTNAAPYSEAEAVSPVGDMKHTKDAQDTPIGDLEVEKDAEIEDDVQESSSGTLCDASDGVEVFVVEQKLGDLKIDDIGVVEVENGETHPP